MGTDSDPPACFPVLFPALAAVTVPSYNPFPSGSSASAGFGHQIPFLPAQLSFPPVHGGRVLFGNQQYPGQYTAAGAAGAAADSLGLRVTVAHVPFSASIIACAAGLPPRLFPPLTSDSDPAAVSGPRVAAWGRALAAPAARVPGRPDYRGCGDGGWRP